MNIRTLSQSRRRRLLVLLLPVSVALLVVVLVIGSLAVFAFGDLEVTFKSGSEPPTTTKAGTSHSFAVEVFNNTSGQPDAEAVVFEYRAPAGVVIQDIHSSLPGPCEVGTEGDPSDPSICSLGNMPTGQTYTVYVTVYVLPDVPHGTLLDHDVRAWQFGTEDDPPDNENHAFVTVEAEADLSVSKTAEGDVVTGFDTNTFEDILTPTANEVTAGELIKYTVTITNAGPSDAQNVVVTDTLPAKFDFIESVPAGCWANAANPLLVTCLLDTVPATTTQQIELVVRTRPDAAIDDPDDGNNWRDADNTVQVTSTTDEPAGGGDPNTNTITTRVTAVANLEITKTDIPDPALAGEEVVYEVTARNLGPSKSRAIQIGDFLPDGLVFVRCEPLDPDEEPVCSAMGQMVTLDDFRINGQSRDDLMPDEERSFRIVAYARSNLVKEPNLYAGAPDAVGNLVTITNTVWISDALDITDYYTATTRDRELTGVTSEADLAVSKTDTPNPAQNLYYDPVTNNFVYTYTITVENLGPSDAGRVILTDTLPIYASLDMVGGDPLTAITTTGSPTGALSIRFRDDGVVIVDWGQIAGNDDRRDDLDLTNPANPSLPTTRTLTIRVRVDADVAPDIGYLENRVEVGTVPGDVCPTQTDTFVCPDPWPHGYTPTPDSNLSNNVYIEYTALVSPEVKVDKKVYVRKSPARGIDVTTDGLTEVERCEAYATDDILTLPGDEVTYCYTITNEGDSWLHSITLQDQSDALIYRAPLGRFEVIYPGQTDQPPLRGTITWVGGNTDETQTITIKTTESEVAVMSPKGVPDPDGYDHILIIRSFTVDFPELGPIAGIVWEDTNGNHVVDLNEPPSPGLGVDLLNESGSDVLVSTTTDAEGRYAFHDWPPGSYMVRVYEIGPPRVTIGVSPVIEFNLSEGYSIANFDRLFSQWYIESEWYSERIFRMLGTNTARVDAIPSTKYSTPLPGIEPSGDCEDPDLVCDTDLLHDTLALPVLEDTTKEWAIYEDNGDDLPSPKDVIEYTVDIPNTGIIEATGVEFYDGLYNWIADDANDLHVPGVLINGSVSAAIHVYGREPGTGRDIDADLQPPDLAFGDDLLLRTYAPAIGGGYLELTYPSAVVLESEILKGNNADEDEVEVATRLAIPPVGYLLRFDGVTYDPPIPVTFSLRIKYRVRIKETKYVRLGTIVLNHGWLTYNEMGLFDQRFPDFDPTDTDAYTAANKVANNHAGTPGRDYESPEFPGWPEVPEDVEPTNYPGDRFDDYAQPGAALRDDDDPTWFKLERQPRRVQLPAIDHEDGWETEIQVQNGGDEATAAIVFFWGEYSGLCPSNDPGPIGHACSWIPENGLWSLEDQVIPSTAKSAIVYSVDKDLFEEACDAADYVFFEPSPLDPRSKSTKWRDWEDEYEGTGEPIAVIAQRQGPNDYGTVVASAYPGISENKEGGGPEYQYYAPYAMRQYYNLDTEIIIQNSGQRCTEVWLEYQKQDDCVFSYEEHIAQLAPGESVRKRVPEALGAEWLGSIYVTANEPLGIVMDQTSFLPSEDRGVLLTYEARPYKLTTDTVFYADLVWREVSGWDASIQVQNLTQHSQPTFVTVEFFDASGDSILFLGDWVCRSGGATFYLPVVADLGMEYAGAAVIESHAQVDYPGGMHDGQPIFAVVDLKKRMMWDADRNEWRPTVPGENQGGSYNALAEGEKKAAGGDVMLPSLTKGWDDEGVTSLVAVRNNSNCNDIKLKLEVRKGTGTVVTYVTDFWLRAKHVRLIDLANVGSVNPGFVGAGTVEVTEVEQLCDVDNDGHMDEEPTMLSVVVVNKGVGPGDVTSIYEGVPVALWGFP